MSPTSEERLKRGDVYQMVESIAFFEAYRPVLIGLQMMSSADFPFKVCLLQSKLSWLLIEVGLLALVSLISLHF